MLPERSLTSALGSLSHPSLPHSPLAPHPSHPVTLLAHLAHSCSPLAPSRHNRLQDIFSSLGGPFALPPEWHCVNCTTPNRGDTCEECGEASECRGAFDVSFMHRPPQPRHTAGQVTIWSCDERMMLHRPDKDHPERPDRVKAIREHLIRSGLMQDTPERQAERDEAHRSGLSSYPRPPPGEKAWWIPARLVTDDELRLVHTQEHLDKVVSLTKTAAETQETQWYSGGDVYLCAETVRRRGGWRERRKGAREGRKRRKEHRT